MSGSSTLDAGEFTVTGSLREADRGRLEDTGSSMDEAGECTLCCSTSRIWAETLAVTGARAGMVSSAVKSMKSGTFVALVEGVGGFHPWTI